MGARLCSSRNGLFDHSHPSSVYYISSIRVSLEEEFVVIPDRRELLYVVGLKGG
jgi:hypothetical protein